MMYVVAGHIIETLTGGSMEKFLKERIWQPLGMKSTVSQSLFPMFSFPALKGPETTT